MSYKDRMEELEDNAHLISMVPVCGLLRFGYLDSSVISACTAFRSAPGLSNCADSAQYWSHTRRIVFRS